MRIMGMMSGTSVDSIDAVIADIELQDGGRISATVVGFHENEMPQRLRERIFESFRDREQSLSLTCSLNFEIGEAFADAANASLAACGVSAESVTAIASHGQTVYHIAPHMKSDGRTPSTLQIGEGSVIAERTGLPVICDFRVADMAAGGNGAPLVPFADYHLFSQQDETIIVQNIGGIANATVLPASGKLDEVVAFDTGPGNMIIDALMQRFFQQSYDRDGTTGRTGAIQEQLLADWMSTPYIAAQPPKTTGRELFGVQFAEKIASQNPATKPADLIATATAFTARTIVQNFVLHVFPRAKVSQLLLAGGGAKNGFLVELIRREMTTASPSTKVRLLDDIGFESKARECLAFAILGFARLRGIPGNVPSATGAKHPALLGKIIEPYGSKKLSIRA